MDNKLTGKDITDFLLNAYFGEVSDLIFTAVSSAYLDLNRTIEFKKGQDVTEEKKATLRQKCVKTIKDQILNLSKNDHFDNASGY